MNKAIAPTLQGYISQLVGTVVGNSATRLTATWDFSSSTISNELVIEGRFVGTIHIGVVNTGSPTLTLQEYDPTSDTWLDTSIIATGSVSTVTRITPETLVKEVTGHRSLKFRWSSTITITGQIVLYLN